VGRDLLDCLKVVSQYFTVGIEKNLENQRAENIRQCIV